MHNIKTRKVLKKSIFKLHYLAKLSMMESCCGCFLQNSATKRKFKTKQGKDGD